MRQSNGGGHIHDSFDKFCLLDLRHCFVTAQEFSGAKAVAAFQRFFRQRLSGSRRLRPRGCGYVCHTHRITRDAGRGNFISVTPKTCRSLSRFCECCLNMADARTKTPRATFVARPN